MNPSHAFALWFTVTSLKPKYIIESGVWCGQTTWLLRQAAGNEAWIFSLDPFDYETQCPYSFRETKFQRTMYFLGKKFVDLSSMIWDNLIPPLERHETLVLLDDH